MSRRDPRRDARAAARAKGLALARTHGLLRRLLDAGVGTGEADGADLPRDVWVAVDQQGYLRVNLAIEGAPEEWAWVFGHAILHVALGHTGAHADGPAWQLAADMEANALLDRLGVGRAPQPYRLSPPVEIGGRGAEEVYEQLLGRVGPQAAPADLIQAPPRRWLRTRDWDRVFADALRAALAEAFASFGEGTVHADDASPIGDAAREWTLLHFPLLARLAAGVRVVERHEVCDRLEIPIAAVDASEKVIYLNPRAGLREEEWRFVYCHELLHLGLRHEERCAWREPYLWNVACDYAINAWLVEMQVGVMPSVGALHDPELSGASSEDIYDRIAGDLRRLRRLATFAGKGRGDVLGPGAPWWERGVGRDLDAFYREALMQGLELTQSQGRGLLPADLVEEIRAVTQPPIPWDVRLAEWFDVHFPPRERRRSYARPSRRQSATPDIPRPRYVDEDIDAPGATFAVLLDTSASMDTRLLAKALGTIAAYAAARDVTRLRLVYCDASAHDEGFIRPEELLETKVTVKGRGGTVLMPGVRLLEAAKDLPPDAPLLILTDGWTDRLTIAREHAYVLPAWGRLPFSPRGPVFRVR